jgi:1-acyl-sn-glycerol-3-phosphate acyltransferase
VIIYLFLKNLTGLAQKIFFRKIYFINKQLIPSNKVPIIFAINHPTAFTDSFIFMVYTYHNCYFILRGDFFKVPRPMKFFMATIRLIPVFRQRDGFSALRQNQQLFETFYDLLHKKGSISIMVEGSHDKSKRLNPIQRGTAKIAFGFFEKYNDDSLIICPIGLTYSDVTAFRGTAAIKVAEPIYIKDYIEDYKNNARKTEQALTKEIESRIRTCLVHIANPQDDELAETLLDMHRNSTSIPLLPPISKDGQPLEREITFIHQFNELPTTAKDDLRKKTENYFDQLKSLKIEDLGVIKNNQFNLLNSFLLILGLPFFIIALLTSGLPMLATLQIRKKIKKEEFIGSVSMVAGMFSYLIYYSILLIIGLVIGNWWGLIAMIIIPLVGYIGLLYRDFFLAWNKARKFKIIPKTTQQKLLQERTAILNSVIALEKSTT